MGEKISAPLSRPERALNVPDQEPRDRGLVVEVVPVLQGTKAGLVGFSMMAGAKRDGQVVRAAGADGLRMMGRYISRALRTVAEAAKGASSPRSP